MIPGLIISNRIRSVARLATAIARFFRGPNAVFLSCETAEMDHQNLLECPSA